MYIPYPHLQGAVRDGALNFGNSRYAGKIRFSALPLLTAISLFAFLFSGRVLRHWGFRLHLLQHLATGTPVKAFPVFKKIIYPPF